MAKKSSLKENYQKLLEWYQYRAEENAGSLEKLLVLLAALDRKVDGPADYEKDIDDLESLKFIYETGIRKFESQVDKYQELLQAGEG
ncbi:hypothetical protein MUK70_05375 [Dyadobacter chenwenxiniae]|uniref:Uncharacterized protein n=1 Tax=Dyadobacter chenwenxiniae TaxID=2906456 RepID=A0A9X1PTE9_9BACT|nr:hypothetical protein [Dyadobacter chenwenxiniae]MCF0050443.1 hypothetical protein [Dyadobacter chenwenxiniae]MCF0065313.1 hypothetical protein [Dyadobacter chenwenxiniae]UON84419.1 hypothetical protein MUK70_05375 [Dyadobacter chenwenxiniae]